MRQRAVALQLARGVPRIRPAHLAQAILQCQSGGGDGGSVTDGAGYGSPRFFYAMRGKARVLKYSMAAMGAVAGTHPELATMDMPRSLIGSVTPFLVFFCVNPPGWGAKVRRAISYAPMLSVVLGAALGVVGLRPVVFDSGGIRLAGLGHPAFLAGVCLPAIYAGLLHWLRTGSRRAASNRATARVTVSDIFGSF